MKFTNWFAALVVLCLAAAASPQREQKQDQPSEQKQKQQQEEQQRPTLGPPAESPAGGPRTSTTTDARKLLRVRSIYVERIDNALSEKLADVLSKSGRFRIAATRSEADAVLRGTCFDSRRLKSVHSEVFLTDRGGNSIWQDIVHRPFNPPVLPKAVESTAVDIVQHLTDSAREAERKQ